MKSIAQYLEEDLRKWKDKDYIWTKKQGTFISTSFGETITHIHQMAKALTGRGYQNKNIMIYSENSYQWMVLDLCIMGYVGVSVPIDKEWTSHDLIGTLNSIDVSLIFYSESKKEVIREVTELYEQIDYICIQEEFDQLIHEGREMKYMLSERNNMEQTAKILFTSGTTDIPKAIPLTQKNMFNNWETLYERTPMTKEDRSYLFLPLNHVYSGVANFLYTIISGMEIYLCSDLNQMVQEMMEIQPTVVCTVPLIMNRIYEVINDNILDMLRKVRFLYCGGSFTDYDLKKYFIEKGVCLLEAYGTTETSSVIALDQVGDKNIKSNGVVFENLIVKIINKDETGAGELLVKGGSVSKDYYDAEGFYHTGDLAVLDEAGHLYLKGRKRRCIIMENGKNVYPEEIEELILNERGINKIKVYEEEGKIAAAVVSDLEENKVLSYLASINEKLPKFKRIQKIYVSRDCLGSRIK